MTKSQRLTNQSGTVIATVELDPWGGETSRSSNQARQPRRYTTYTRDANASDEAMHRRYNRWWSRFDQPDPYDGSYDLTNPQSFNRYSYVESDPVNHIDPTGLFRPLGNHEQIVRTNPNLNPYFGDFFGYSDLGLGTFYGGSLIAVAEARYVQMVERTTQSFREASAQRRYDRARERILDRLQNSERCRNYLSSHGINPDNAINAVRSQRAHDGTRSNVSQLQAGLISPAQYNRLRNARGAAYADQTYNAPVSQLFEQRRGLGAVTAMFSGDRNDVYFRPSRITPQQILHEALHSLTGMDDYQIGLQLGLSRRDLEQISRNDNTIVISNALKRNGCG